ncbi:hypothetical protein FVE85_0849 [Porphyridium purpureum]|uniref:Uncharacterized protein n=1 Tax=Porphyridium purpureum TaxID=35688 RepID=A0A5J4Z1G7_PORPP|nr:hypothetical protein FVE85_0849 [Porphyridium purpureum]|eukprot:POR3836..scf208_2
MGDEVAKRKAGRPQMYVFDRPDAELTEAERKLKSSILKRRQRQNQSYHRKRALLQAHESGDLSASLAELGVGTDLRGPLSSSGARAANSSSTQSHVQGAHRTPRTHANASGTSSASSHVTSEERDTTKMNGGALENLMESFSHETSNENEYQPNLAPYDSFVRNVVEGAPWLRFVEGPQVAETPNGEAGVPSDDNAYARQLQTSLELFGSTENDFGLGNIEHGVVEPSAAGGSGRRSSHALSGLHESSAPVEMNGGLREARDPTSSSPRAFSMDFLPGSASSSFDLEEFNIDVDGDALARLETPNIFKDPAFALQGDFRYMGTSYIPAQDLADDDSSDQTGTHLGSEPPSDERSPCLSELGRKSHAQPEQEKHEKRQTSRGSLSRGEVDDPIMAVIGSELDGANAEIDTVRSVYEMLPDSSKDAFICLGVFPRCFDIHAAAAVCNIDGVEECYRVLQPLLQLDLLCACGLFSGLDGTQRAELSKPARMFLSPETLSNSSFMHNAYVEDVLSKANRRFIDHFIRRLEGLNSLETYKQGKVRERLMQTYDIDRHNYETLFSRTRTSGVCDHARALTAAPIVMRFCVGARSRLKYFQRVLKSMQDIVCHVRRQELHVARVELGLAEAFMDLLMLRHAEAPLQRALDYYEPFLERREFENDMQIIDACLCVLIKANLHLMQGDIDQTNVITVRVLKLLYSHGMGKTTLAVNALANLISCKLARSELTAAAKLNCKVLEVLKCMQYSELPIYADLLGVAGVVSLLMKDPIGAETSFRGALAIVCKFGDKKWFDAPLQHCLDLDLWLMKGLAHALSDQGNQKESDELIKDIRTHWTTRGLGDGFDPDVELGADALERWILHSRHMY